MKDILLYGALVGAVIAIAMPIMNTLGVNLNAQGTAVNAGVAAQTGALTALASTGTTGG